MAPTSICTIFTLQKCPTMWHHAHYNDMVPSIVGGDDFIKGSRSNDFGGGASYRIKD